MQHGNKSRDAKADAHEARADTPVPLAPAELFICRDAGATEDERPRRLPWLRATCMTCTRAEFHGASRRSERHATLRVAGRSPCCRAAHMVQPRFSREMRENGIAAGQRSLQSLRAGVGPLHLGLAWWHWLHEFSGVVFVRCVHRPDAQAGTRSSSCSGASPLHVAWDANRRAAAARAKRVKRCRLLRCRRTDTQLAEGRREGGTSLRF